mgnify:CR=1 FL=1
MPTWSITAPDGGLEIEVTGSSTSATPLTYRVLRNGVEVVHSSRLGVAIGSEDHSVARVAAATPPVLLDSTYELVHGKRRVNRSHGYQRILTLETAGGSRSLLITCAHDDAVAFRFMVLGNEPVPLGPEASSFILGSGNAWIQSHDFDGLATPAYEAPYTNGSPIGEAPNGPSWNMPALFEVDDTWVLLAEADQPPNAFGSHLEAIDGGYRLQPPEVEEGNGVGDLWPIVERGWQTPWRVIGVGDLATIVESTIVTDLASPSRIENTSWIVPGRASWHWWSDHGSTSDLDRLAAFVDFAGDMGWEHTLIDANWQVHSDDEISTLIHRADTLGVRTWLWYNSGGPNNDVPEAPRDRMFDREVRRAEMARVAGLGIAGIKVDFFHSDKPAIIDLQWQILEDAADCGLMINFHGCNVPRGWNRTWPHLMTQEGVRGAEQYGFDGSWPDTAVWHNTVLPFTRNVVGPMDYTPVSLSDQLFPRSTTSMHEVALAIVFESGVQHFADSPEGIGSLPTAVVDLLRGVPSIWDETRLVAGRPGSHVVIARRHGDRWWIGGICGRAAVDVELDLASFEGMHSATLHEDGPNDTPTTSTLDVELDQPVWIRIPAAGGFAVELTR